jgi:hypothetical protein
LRSPSIASGASFREKARRRDVETLCPTSRRAASRLPRGARPHRRLRTTLDARGGPGPVAAGAYGGAGSAALADRHRRSPRALRRGGGDRLRGGAKARRRSRHGGRPSCSVVRLLDSGDGLSMPAHDLRTDGEPALARSSDGCRGRSVKCRCGWPRRGSTRGRIRGPGPTRMPNRTEEPWLPGRRRRS